MGERQTHISFRWGCEEGEALEVAFWPASNEIVCAR